MTNEQAIRHLEDLQRLYLGNEKFTADIEAIGIAIEALKRTSWIPNEEGQPKPKAFQECLFTQTGFSWEGEKKKLIVFQKAYGGETDFLAWMPLPKPYRKEGEK